MPGGTSLPYGNVKNAFLLNLTVTTQTITGTYGGEVTFSVPGLLTTDNVDVNKPSLTQYVTIGNVRVSAANVLAITFSNSSTGNITTPASEVYSVIVTRPDYAPPGSPPSGIV
jgi:hypothetical protein